MSESSKPDGELLDTINDVEIIQAESGISLWCSVCIRQIAFGYDLEASKGRSSDHDHLAKLKRIRSPRKPRKN